MKFWIWRNFRIKVPNDWEMLQFSKNIQVGNCMFADRYQFRLEFNWRVIEGPPDFNRLMSDYTSSLKQEKKTSGVENLQVGKWRGIEVRADSLYTSRFGRFFPNESCLIEIVFLWPKERDIGLEQSILNSIEEESVVDNNFRKWKSFGMDILISKDLKLQNCRIKPAYAEMIFTTDNKEERFERLGMTNQWLKTSVKEWLLKKVPKDVTVATRNSIKVSGHQIDTIIGFKYKNIFSKLLKKKTHYKSSAWICPTDERLYNVAYVYKVLDETGFLKNRLTCCQNMGSNNE